MQANRPECPQVWDTIPLADSGRGTPARLIVPASGLPVPGPQTNIPEFNDCQRFIGVRATEFEALYAIFASNRLDSIGRSLGLDSATWSSSNPAVAVVSVGGVVTAVAPGTAILSAIKPGLPSPLAAAAVVVTPQPTATISGSLVVASGRGTKVALGIGQSVSLALAGNTPTVSAIPAAQIFTYGSGYAPLGIGANFSCLYLFYDNDGVLSARMVPEKTEREDDRPCDGALNPNRTAGKTLTVIRTQPGTTASDYPSVARWDYDTANGQYSIGIRCGNAWCEVGAPGRRAFTPSLTVPYDPTASPEDNRVLRVKGWHDQQHLAIDAAVGAPVVPSGILATVVPNPNLGKVQGPDYELGQWVTTGYVGMNVDKATPDQLAYYKRKFNYDPVPVALPLTKMNTLSFCYGRRRQCKVPDAPTGKGCDDAVWGVPIRRVWWVKIQAATDGTVMYRCITRRGHDGMQNSNQIAPTARWRWVASDDTVWEYCAAHHCCEVGVDQISAGW